ncbi:unnamed protein product [Knipowitschia caucasica]
MLQNGKPRSFSKFFHVLSLDEERKDGQEHNRGHTQPAPLQDQPEKMHKMKEHLTQAEQAEVSGRWSTVCEQYLSLGLYFSSDSDLWLRLHFLHICCDREHGCSSRAATEARAQLAEIYLKQGDLSVALQQAERCLRQAEDGAWQDSSGFPLKTRAQHALWRTITRQTDAPLQSKNYAKAIALLHQALNIAKDSGSKSIEGEATYNLGVSYQLSGDHTIAKKHFNKYMEICQELDNASGLGKAYRAIAKSLEREKNTEEMVWCLKKLTDGSVNSLLCDLVDACLSLGNIHSDMGEYAQACEYFQRSYEGAVNLGDFSLLQKTQVLLGRAKALNRLFRSDVQTDSRSSLQKLLYWKENREWDESVQPASNSTKEVTSSHL